MVSFWDLLFAQPEVFLKSDNNEGLQKSRKKGKIPKSKANDTVNKNRKFENFNRKKY